MVTKQDVVISFRDYGDITVPKGTKLTHTTAMGVDKDYHFVNEFGWIDRGYPEISSMLKHDAEYYGINIPKEYVEY